MTTYTYTTRSPQAAARALEQVDVREVIFRASVGIIAVSLLMYGYFIAATVTDVIARSHAEKMAVALNTEVSDLESSYLAQSAGITRTFAAAQGYTEAVGTLFAVAGGAGKEVAFAKHEVR